MAERLISLISGSGSTAEYIAQSVRDEKIPGLEFAGVIASNRDIEGIQRINELKMGIPVTVIDPQDFPNGEGGINTVAFGEEIINFARDNGATVLTQNGWKPWTPDNVVDEYEGSFFNQHPGPLYETRNQYGLTPYATMFRFSQLAGRDTGTYVVAQRVDKKMDAGALVGVRYLPILAHDTPLTLRMRGISLEHALQVEILNKFVRKELVELEELRIADDTEAALLKEARRWAREYQRSNE